MSYVKRMVCLAHSYKSGGMCVAGREITPNGFGAWLRPVSDRAKGELQPQGCCYANGKAPRLLDVIDVPFARPHPQHHQVENHLIDGGQRWTKRGELPVTALAAIVERPLRLWTDSYRTATGLLNCMSPAEARMHKSSLRLIESRDFVVQTFAKADGRYSYRGMFRVGSSRYKLNITDPCVIQRFDLLPRGEYPFDEYRSIFLCISLTEKYDQDGRCHKLVAGVITDPPL